MTGRDRVRAVLAGREPDRTPVLAGMLANAAWLQGVPQRRFHTDAATLASCVVQASRAVGLDGVYVSSDNWVMYQALGGEVVFPDDDEPHTRFGDPTSTPLRGASPAETLFFPTVFHLLRMLCEGEFVWSAPRRASDRLDHAFPGRPRELP